MPSPFFPNDPHFFSYWKDLGSYRALPPALSFTFLETSSDTGLKTYNGLIINVHEQEFIIVPRERKRKAETKHQSWDHRPNPQRPAQGIPSKCLFTRRPKLSGVRTQVSYKLTKCCPMKLPHPTLTEASELHKHRLIQSTQGRPYQYHTPMFSYLRAIQTNSH